MIDTNFLMTAQSCNNISIAPIASSKAVYMTGTKKQKMDMSKAIVESIYSMEPPGRFLKQCPGEAGQWIELSRREEADKTAQAMAYAINGESLKEKRRERRHARLPPSLRPLDVVAKKSSQTQSVGRPTKDNHYLGGVRSSSVARHHGLAARGGSAGTTNAQSAVNDDHNDSADLVATNNEMVLPGDNPNLSQSQQLTPQLLQSISTVLPTYSGAPLDVDANHDGLVQVLAQALQQQRRHLQQQQRYQQQLYLQHTLGQDLFGLGTQTPLQPASLAGLTQQLSQAQQYQQQQLLFQHLLNQQNVLPSASLPSTLSLPAPFLSASSPNDDFLRGSGTASNFNLTGPRSQPSNVSNLSQEQCNLQSNTSDALSLSVLGDQPNNVGLSIAPQQASQLDQVQRSLVRQQQQLLASSLSNPPSNNSLLQQQLQSLPLHQWQAALQLQQHSQDPPRPSLNSDAAELLSANHRSKPPSSRGEKSRKRRR